MKLKRRNQNQPKSRKDLRKEKRQLKKTNRFNYHNKKSVKNVKNSKNAKKSNAGKGINKFTSAKHQEVVDDDDEEITSDEEMLDEEVKPVKPVAAVKSSKIDDFIAKEKKTEQKYFNSLKNKRIDQLKQQNEEEDKIIKKYEKLLKLNSKKKKSASGDGLSKFNDGLDYLLEICTDENIQKMYDAAKETDEFMKKSKDTQSDRNKKLKEIETKYLGDDEDYFNNLNEDDFDDDLSGEDSELESGEDDASVEDEEEDQSMSEENSEESENDDEEMSEEEPKVDTWEDIYGRTRDKQGNILKQEATKYVPPHLRNVQKEDDDSKNEKLNIIRRQIKGFINRLSEVNLHRISIDLEQMFNQNPRHDVNSCLMQCIFDSTVSNILSKERQILEHILLISVLHANIGSEIGAYFLEHLVKNFKNHLENVDVIEDKTVDNLVLILCHLYTFKVVSHNIIYELLDKLRSNITDKKIECILLILKSVGILLRKDEPLRLKEFIMKVQNVATSEQINEEYKSKHSFMLDILLAVKNNNITKIPNFDPELLEHFRKLQKQFLRAGKYVSTLTVTMEDIENAEKTGRWWLVGSAWLGNNSTQKSALKDTKNDEKPKNDQQEKIFELARKQKMNTDEKRNIFYILMTSEDYLDAYEKLMSTSKNEKVVSAVILHCCLSEKSFNPFYYVLSEKLCEQNRKYLLAFKFTIWDKIKELSTHQISNLAQFTFSSIESGILPLSLLKIIEFDKMEKLYVKFLKNVMMKILLCDEDKFHAIFQKISPVKKLNSFKDQLRLFLKVFLMKSDRNKFKLSDADFLKFNERVTMADKYLIAKILS